MDERSKRQLYSKVLQIVVSSPQRCPWKVVKDYQTNRSKRRLYAESNEGENCINVNSSLMLFLAGPAWKQVYCRITRLPTMDIKRDMKLKEFEKLPN